MTKAQKDFLPNEKYGSVRFHKGTQIDYVAPPSSSSVFTHPGGVAAPIWKTLAQLWTLLAGSVFDATAPTTSAVGDVAAAGSAATAAHRDHLHGRESFATPAIVLGTAAAGGAATTPIRSDATILAFDATSPAASAVGDAAVVGTATVTARRDHKHARETNAWTAVTYASGNFSTDTGTWTVDSGDQIAYSYVLIGKTMTINWNFITTTVAGTCPTLKLAIPASQTCKTRTDTTCLLRDNGVAALGQATVLATGTVIRVIRADLANFTVCTDNTQITGEITFEVT